MDTETTQQAESQTDSKPANQQGTSPAFTIKAPTQPDQIQAIIDDMEDYFKTGITLSVAFRKQQLLNMKAWLKEHEGEVLGALTADLGKAPYEGYVTELGLVYDEINTMVKHLPFWACPKFARTPIVHFPSVSRVYPVPYGVAAIMAPWNYPVQLCMIPMVDAIAAGNCVFVKPSKTSIHTGAIIQKMIDETFDPRFAHCVFDLENLDPNMLKMRVDYMFFTGSPRVGHEIMHACANNLTPLTLELGGKSPVFIDQTADLKRAGQRIAWGKCLNSGQTCVAPDYLLVHEDMVDDLVKELKTYLHRYFGEDILKNPQYPHMINQHHFEMVCSLIDNINPNAKVVEGGGRDPETLKIEPTIITGVTLDDPVMGQEIFGPVLPILTWKTIDEAIAITEHFGHPLACYIFSNDKKMQQYLIHRVPYGGGCVNDVVIHVANNHIGFGGFGNSGMGEYHGKRGFDCFTHYKSVVDHSTLIEMDIRTAPYEDWKFKLARLFMH